MKIAVETNQPPNKKRETQKRSAGILLHLTSLPTPFGIGDLGPSAKAFADFLYRNKQKYWQILPTGPIEKEQAYSPYSSTSSMAGNILLISPELLREDALLTEHDLKRFQIKNNGKVKYDEATRNKEILFEKAYSSFSKRQNPMNRQFEMFCEEETLWLNDYSLYVALKQQFKKPWYQWSDDFRYRDPSALEKFKTKNIETIEKIKWLQFIFTRQWEQFRFYCNQLNVSLFGDLPFYVSHDSADVWAHPEIFALDDEKDLKAQAGVPPDYFNSNGQLWGMPVFNWETLKEKNYDWWIGRLKKNIEMFDVLRLDHFRAFSEYWEVPAHDKTAKNGQWKPGPGADFFLSVKKALGKLPFIAEDLGDINESVISLREKFGFPGMKVLQFAFSGNMGKSEYLPQHYSPDFIAYTGTHDNNTTIGWYRKDVKNEERQNVSQYLGKRIDQNNVHIELARSAYSSVAKTVIIPMQDILGLDESARMNTPALVKNNWLWRLKPEHLIIPKTELRLQQWASLYNRC
jgi:4-alpha-glucanotransferase